MDKLNHLKEIISSYKSVTIGYSGGVDSVFLAAVSKSVLDRNLLLVISNSELHSKSEFKEAVKIAEFLDIEYRVIKTNECQIPEVVNNTPQRCFFCKKELFSKIGDVAKNFGAEVVFDGSNIDDLSDYRPGMKALKELKIISPLIDANLGKNEIRKFSKDLSLPTWDKPSFACLASRFPYGEKINDKSLIRIDNVESKIRELGFNQFRARSHGDCVRIEFLSKDLDHAWLKKNKITKICNNYGFTYVSIDTVGYRMGAMNEVLK